MIPAREALQRLQAGNERFVVHRSEHDTLTSVERRLRLSAAQEPFAVILGCSDSRVPAEIVFDQGLGDLFVIRVTGNIVASSQIGSVEFAVEVFGTPPAACAYSSAPICAMAPPSRKAVPVVSSSMPMAVRTPNSRPRVATTAMHGT